MEPVNTIGLCILTLLSLLYTNEIVIVSRNKRGTSFLIESYLVGVVMLLVPFHAFLTVWASSAVGQYTLLRLWPVSMTCVLFVVMVYHLIRNKSKRTLYKQSYIVKIILGYTAFVVSFGLIAFALDGVSLKAMAYGVLLNVRFFIWFLFVFLLAKNSDWLKKHWQPVVLVPLVAVTFFALLQYFVLPTNFLDHFGYERGVTIPPVQTINEDASTIRTQSFLRGPNQLGLYLMFGTAMLLAILLRAKSLSRKYAASLTVGLVLVMLALVTTHSRSAWLGTIVILGVAFAIGVGRRIPRRYLALTITSLLIIGVVGTVGLQHTQGFKNIILHESLNKDNTAASNDGHLGGIKSGLADIAEDPIGDGPGTAGPASAYNTAQPARISESQYLNIGQELGWLGLIFFMSMTIFIGLRLFLMQNDPLSYGLFLSLIGVSVANIFMYSWFDETLAYIWWGLAGVVVARVVPSDKSESMRRSFINLNRWLSTAFDKLFVPARYRVDGLEHYTQQVVPPLVKPRMQIYDIGGGKRPFIGMQMARPDNVWVVGVDIDKDELTQAPDGLYDSTIVADVAAPKGFGFVKKPADLIICAALLEHVSRNDRAMRNIADITKKGGKIVLFIPAKNAAFAQLNRILPEEFKRKVLFGLFPETVHAQGFPAYYDKCTPSEFIKLCESNGFRVDLVRPYYQSTYFSFLFPAHIVWRICQLMAFLILRRDAAESFTIVAVKK